MHNQDEISCSGIETGSRTGTGSRTEIGPCLSRPLSIKATQVCTLFMISSLLCLCSAGYEDAEIRFYSGQEYSFLTPCGDFLYLWNASAGSNAGTDECLFLWTAPILDSPAEVRISVLVSNKDLISCNSRDEVNLTVYPHPDCIIAAPQVVCQNSTNNTATTQDAGSNASYIWTIEGGEITSGNGTNKINWTAGPAGFCRIAVSVAVVNGTVSQCDNIIRVIECEALSITCPQELTVCADPGRDYATILPDELGEASSNDPQAEISSNAPEDNRYPIGERAVTWTAANAAGQKASCDQRIMVVSCSKPRLELNKTADPANAVGIGEDVNFTLTLCNRGSVTLTDIVLLDDLPSGVDLVSVYPEPQSDCLWNVDTLEPGECYEVNLRVSPAKKDLSYEMSQKVKGEGFVNIRADYDSSIGPDSIKNCAYATANNISTISSCATVRIKDPKTSLERRESGSGSYSSDERSQLQAINHSIMSSSSFSAQYNPTSFVLPAGRSIEYDSLWAQSSKSRNELTGTSISERYRSATKIDVNRSIELDENGSRSISEVDFKGIGQISVLKKNAGTHALPVYHSEEEYAGSFQSREYVDSYDSGLFSNRSTRGRGYVAVDKMIGNSQRTYESGTGSYASEEVIETATSYIHKNISLVHSPISMAYSPNLLANHSIKWSEGIRSESGSFEGVRSSNSICSPFSGAGENGGMISERYSYLDRMEKESTASGLKDMKTLANFSGQGNFRIRYIGENGTDEVDSQESYIGSYAIQRHSILNGHTRYDIPHLTAKVEGEIREELHEGNPAAIGRYNITVTNDGSCSLAPVKIINLLPPGAEYIRSTIRPSSLGPDQVNWTVQSLGSENSITIGLALNLTGAAMGDVVNRVIACGGYDEDHVCSSDYSVQEREMLACCPPRVSVSKRGVPDAIDPSVVKYDILLTNNGGDSVTVTVTDQLPAGMRLLSASTYPDRMEGDKMVWVLPQLSFGESKRIEYTAQATRDGEYGSTVHIDAAAINGTGYYVSDSAANIWVNGTEAAPRSFRYGEWEPPAWNLARSEESIQEIIDSFLHKEEE